MLPVQITVRDMPHSSALEKLINEHAQKLLHFCQSINHCQVVVEMPQKHKTQGNFFLVAVTLKVPGKELVVNKKKNEDVYIAVRDAFHAMERQVEKYVEIKRGDVKRHEILTRGYIAKLFPYSGYGFIHSLDGNEFYFNTDNVGHAHFSKLEIGDVVYFIPEITTLGLQAHKVALEKHAAA